MRHDKTNGMIEQAMDLAEAETEGSIKFFCASLGKSCVVTRDSWAEGDWTHSGNTPTYADELL